MHSTYTLERNVMQNRKLLPVFVYVLVFLTGTASSQAATYSINFFDTNHAKVGHGRFTTDPSRSICVEVDISGNCSTANIPDSMGNTQYYYGQVVDKMNPVTSFSANIQGVRWGNIYKSWWVAQGQAPGALAVSRYGINIEYNHWFNGDYEGLRQFFLDIDQATTTSGNGTWGQVVGFGQDGNPFLVTLYGSGTWTASLVPVPAAAWLFVSGLVFLKVFRKKAWVK
jgi:hypothetical protein